MSAPTVVLYNSNKPHRCPECHTVAIAGDDTFSAWKVYTCCNCATQFTRWPRLGRVLPKVGVRCGEHNDRTTEE